MEQVILWTSVNMSILILGFGVGRFYERKKIASRINTMITDLEIMKASIDTSLSGKSHLEVVK